MRERCLTAEARARASGNQEDRVAEALRSDLAELESYLVGTPPSPLAFVIAFMRAVSVTWYVISDISRDKELGCGSDGWRRWVGRRDPKKQKNKKQKNKKTKKNHASFSHRSFPLLPSQA